MPGGTCCSGCEMCAAPAADVDVMPTREGTALGELGTRVWVRHRASWGPGFGYGTRRARGPRLGHGISCTGATGLGSHLCLVLLPVSHSWGEAMSASNPRQGSISDRSTAFAN